MRYERVPRVPRGPSPGEGGGETKRVPCAVMRERRLRFPGICNFFGGLVPATFLCGASPASGKALCATASCSVSRLAEKAEEIEQRHDAEGDAEKPKNETAGHWGLRLVVQVAGQRLSRHHGSSRCYWPSLLSLSLSNSRSAFPDNRPPEISRVAKGAALAIWRAVTSI